MPKKEHKNALLVVVIFQIAVNSNIKTNKNPKTYKKTLETDK